MRGPGARRDGRSGRRKEAASAEVVFPRLNLSGGSRPAVSLDDGFLLSEEKPRCKHVDKPSRRMGEVVRLCGKIPDAAELLREAMLSQRFADVALCCTGGQRFLAHRLVLSAASPYLQEVLLAHSKAGNCEPTTVVILPEVEAAELATLLGFVYTGSAMVPRPRLDAFLRAAETLRIPLPPLPPIVGEESKFSPRYVQCDRFSRCAGCCFPKKQELESLSHQQSLPGYTMAYSPGCSSEGFPGPADRETLDQREVLEEEYVDVTGSDDESARNQGQKGSFPAYSGPSGEDLSCREMCCEWRRAKRSVVSNYVTASPWEQIVRLHHSPRSRHGPAHSQEEKPIVPPSSGKLEISHPVSRLCDTIDADQVVSKDEKIEGGKEKELFKSDDNNNNNNSHPAIIPQGPRTPGNEHKCEECGKTFVTRASLKVHGRTHTGEKPFRCLDCGKEFSQLRNYKYHRSVHEGTREFAATCPECGKYFNDRGYLSSHMKIHRNRKEYGCAECGKSFNQRVAYNMHVRIHTGLKPHQCEQCGKAFSRKMLLKQHLRTHSGERPYQCQVCHKAFADRSNMTLHTRLHSGLKPYQCTLCSKAFTKKHHLKTHLNYHTGTKPYSCSNCGLRFSQSSNMRTHFKKCTVNNPSGTKSSDAAGLTPPNSDQESSVLTPVPT